MREFIVSLPQTKLELTYLSQALKNNLYFTIKSYFTPETTSTICVDNRHSNFLIINNPIVNIETELKKYTPNESYVESGSQNIYSSDLLIYFLFCLLCTLL